MSLKFNLSFAPLDKAQQSEYEAFLSADAGEYLAYEGVHVLGAFNDDRDELIGVTVFTGEESAKILSIAVSDDYRRQGVGEAMINRIVESLKDAKARKLICMISENSTGLFFEHCGFTPEGSYSDFSLSLSRVKENAELKVLFEDGSMEGFEEAPVPGSEEAGLLMGFLPIEPEDGVLDYVPSFSTVCKKNGKLIGCFLVSKEGDTFLVNMFHLMSRNLLLLQAMAVRSLKAIADEYGDTTELRFMAVTAKAFEVFSKLFPAESKEGKLECYERPLN